MSFRAATEGTPTAFYDTVTAAAKYLAENAPKEHRRVILVISDGDDNFSMGIRDAAIADYQNSHGDGTVKNPANMTRGEQRIALNDMHHKSQQDVQKNVQRADTVFYSINPSGESIRLNVISTRAENGMQAIADATGGTAFVPNTDQDLEKVFRQIAAELHAQYLLQYYSSDESPTGKFIPIKVTLTSQARYGVRARQVITQRNIRKNVIDESRPEHQSACSLRPIGRVRNDHTVRIPLIESHLLRRPPNQPT